MSGARRFLPKCPLYVQDFFGSLRVQKMTAEQRGGYIWLLLLQWQEGGLEDDDAALLELAKIRGTPDQHRLLLDAFPLDPDGLRRNAKMAGVRQEADEYCDLQASKASGRWAKHRANAAAEPEQSSGNATAMPGGCPPTPTQTPTQTPKQKQTPSGSPRTRGPTAEKKPETEAQAFVRLFSECFEKQMGIPYKPKKEDYVLATSFLKECGRAEAEELCLIAFEKAEAEEKFGGKKFWSEAISIGVIKSQVRQLRLAAMKSEHRRAQ